MKKLLTLGVLLLGLSQTAQADIWKWVDAFGKTHFVDTIKPIYTWVEDGKVHYADQPGHEDAVSVQLVWMSTGSIEDEKEDASASDSGGDAFPGETAEQRAERERAEAYYCSRATEVYESYQNAPQLYKTNDAGEREYLSKADAEKTVADALAKKNRFCK